MSQINQKWYQYQKYRDLGRSANGLDDPNLDDALRPVRAAAVRQTYLGRDSVGRSVVG